MVLVSLIWGANFAVSKFALQQMAPLSFSAFRFALASGLLFVAGRLMPAGPPLPRRTLLGLIALGVVGNTFYQTAFMNGLKVTSATNSAMIVAFLPVLVAVLGTTLGIERATPAMWLGVLLGSAGVALVVGARGISWSGGTVAGDLLVLFATLCWACYTVGVRRVGRGVDPLRITTITITAGAAGLLLISVPGMLREHWSTMGWKTWGAIGYATVFALVISYPLYNRAVQGIGSGRTALYNCLTPLVAMLVAWITLGETPTWMQIIGVGLVLSGVLLAMTRAPAAASP